MDPVRMTTKRCRDSMICPYELDQMAWQKSAGLAPRPAATRSSALTRLGGVAKSRAAKLSLLQYMLFPKLTPRQRSDSLPEGVDGRPAARSAAIVQSSRQPRIDHPARTPDLLAAVGARIHAGSSHIPPVVGIDIHIAYSLRSRRSCSLLCSDIHRDATREPSKVQNAFTDLEKEKDSQTRRALSFLGLHNTRVDPVLPRKIEGARNLKGRGEGDMIRKRVEKMDEMTLDRDTKGARGDGDEGSASD
ncbi:hypothetical protein PENSPDRAFT_734677 [Peniophora sp. CONT]|nr:hypothetical protein PENSPDRAFT_734677 [Peniophora sp. CONT]